MQALLKQNKMLLFILILYTFNPTFVYSENRASLTKDNSIEIDSISKSTGKGIISITAGKDESFCMITSSGTSVIKIHDNKACITCVETINIAQNLKLPISLFSDRNLNTLNFQIEKGKISTNQKIETIISGGKEYRVPKSPPEIESLELNDAAFSIPCTDETGQFILSGPSGAKLKKNENGFMLIEGEAVLVTK